MKRPVSFFLVEYEDLDAFGYILAFLSLTPPFLVAIQATVYCTLLLVLTHTRSRSQTPGLRSPAQLAGILLFGQLLNELLNLVLKNILRRPRPDSDVLTSDYGMPSSHSQFVAFLMASFPHLVGRLGNALKWPPFIQPLLTSAALLGSFLIAFGRYSQHVLILILFLSLSL